MELDINVVGEVICQQRMKKKLSQEVVSGFAVIARSHWSEIEHGHHPELSLQTYWRIADALDLRPSELLRMIEEEIERREHESQDG